MKTGRMLVVKGNIQLNNSAMLSEYQNINNVRSVPLVTSNY